MEIKTTKGIIAFSMLFVAFFIAISPVQGAMDLTITNTNVNYLQSYGQWQTYNKGELLVYTDPIYLDVPYKTPKLIGTIKAVQVADYKNYYPGECVSFGKALSKSTVQTKDWITGRNVIASANSNPVMKGTVIATWDGTDNYDEDGSANQHVAIFREYQRDSTGKVTGFLVWDQNWVAKRVVGKHSIGTSGTGIYDADKYYVVQVPGKSVTTEIYPAQILTQSISPTIISPKSKLTFVFSIKNPNSDSIKNVRLGAQIRTNSPQGPWIDDPANDKVFTLSPGTKDYSRTFVVPQSASSGYYDSRWVILDDKTGTWIDSETMTKIFEVKTQSQPPVLDTIGDKSVLEKEILTFRISAKDPDGDKVTYSAEGLPNGAKLTSSGLFTWTPGSGTAGKYTVKFIATANGQTDSETITITVNKVADNPPVLASIGDKSVSEQKKLSFTLSAKDPDGDKVTYSAEGLPSGAKLTSSGLFTWTPGSGTAGKYTVKFIATANGQTDSETITVTVNNPSSALPEITSITPSKTEAGTFDLTIKGKNFNSKTAVEMVYFDGKYVGQGSIKSRSSTKIVVTEKMTGALPGFYVVKVRNNPSDPATESNGKELTITAVPVTLSISPASGKQGTTFSFTGNGYTPNGKIEWHVRKPDNTEFPVSILTASNSGTLSYTYKSNSGSMIGTYTIWATDKATGRVSNEVKERIR